MGVMRALCVVLSLASVKLTVVASAAHSLALHRVKKSPSKTTHQPPWLASGRLKRPRPRSRHLKTQDAETTDPLVTGIGTHFAYLWVGTPAQRQSVIVDTGSYRTAFPCDPCDDCGDYEMYHESGPFKTSESSTATVSSERWSQHYSEGDGWEAVVVEDEVFVGGDTLVSVPSGGQRAVRFSFGCQDQIGGLFVTQFADGIMGMGIHDEAPVPMMVAGGTLDREAFSLCFGGDESSEGDDDDGEGGGGGTLALGGASTHLHLEPMVFAAMRSKSGIFYTVEVTDIFIVPTDSSSSSLSWSHVDSSTSIGAPSYSSVSSAIVDSGTTFTYLPAALKESFAARWKAVTNTKYDTDSPLDGSINLKQLPDFVFELKKASTTATMTANSVLVTVKPSAYVDHYCPKGEYGDTCFNYLSVLFEGTTSILGANFMQDHDVLFDNSQAGQQIGFARASCSWSGPIEGPTPVPTSTPIPTTTPAPSPAPSLHPDLEDTNSGEGLSASTLLVLCALASLFFAAFCAWAMMKCGKASAAFRQDRAAAAAARQGGALSPGPETSLYGRCCVGVVAVIDGCAVFRQVGVWRRCVCCLCGSGKGAKGGGSSSSRVSSRSPRFAFAALEEEEEDTVADMEADEGHAWSSRADGTPAAIGNSATVELASIGGAGGGGGGVRVDHDDDERCGDDGGLLEDRLGGLVTEERAKKKDAKRGNRRSMPTEEVTQEGASQDDDGAPSPSSPSSPVVAITFNPISMLGRTSTSNLPSKDGYARPGEGSEF